MTDSPQAADGGTTRGAGLPRPVLIMVGLAATTITVAGMRGIAGILAPVLLAVVLSIAAAPIRVWLADKGAARWVGTALSLLTVYLTLVVISLSIVLAGARFATLVPGYQDELTDMVQGLTSWLHDIGVGKAQTTAIVDSFDLGSLAGIATGILGEFLSLLGNFAFLLTLVLFVCLDAGPFGHNLRVIGEHHPGFVRALGSFATGTRKYLLVSTAFGLVVAVIDTALLWALGIPGALLWGLLAFITNYIPNIGFVLGLIPPAVLALLEGGPGLMLAVIGAYSVINVIIQSVIQPKLVGDAVGLSASITFLSLVVWAWILGPLGAVLAIPLTLLVRAMLVDIDPGARWVAGLIGTPHETDERPG